MWTTKVFSHLRSISNDLGTVLYTYSCATPVRASLLMAGYFVGHGQSIGLREETTVAATKIAALKNPLGDRWLTRWGRSQTQFTLGGEFPEGDALSRLLALHPQFANLE